MGAFLEKPKTEKHTQNGDGHELRWGVSAMQGWRMDMEDSHTCNTDFALKDCAFFAVFDGHASAYVSKYCSEKLLPTIVSLVSPNDAGPEMMKTAIYQGFLNIDEKLSNEPPLKSGDDRGGTTAVCVMVTPNKLIWANCGDSRGLLCRDGKLHYFTLDHKPSNHAEKSRIERAGGTVMMQRVNGSLAVSRALGDFDYKRRDELGATEQLVSPEPDMEVLERDEKDQFLLLACDGIYDVMTNEEVVQYVLSQLELENDLSKICSGLIDTCLNKNSKDNMSVVLVTFPNAPKASQDAIAKVGSRLGEETSWANNEILKKEVIVQIEEKLFVLVSEAHDPMELDENTIMETLRHSINTTYNIFTLRPYISEKLKELKVIKFEGEKKGDNPESYFGNEDEFMQQVGTRHSDPTSPPQESL